MPFPPVKLNDGNTIPVVAFGTGTALYGKECTDLVLEALETGYVSLDTAQIYSNSRSVGDALEKWQQKGHKREDVYVLTKCECERCVGLEEGIERRTWALGWSSVS